MLIANETVSTPDLYVLTGDGSAEAADIFRVNELMAENKMVWLSLPFESARDVLKEMPSISSLVLNSLCVRDSRPRALLLSDESLLFNMRTVNTGANPEDMISVRIWASARVLITVYRTESQALKELERVLLTNQGPKTIDGCFMQLLEKMLDHISDVTCALDNEVDVLEEKITKQTWKVTRSELSEVRHRIASMRRHLVPERDAIGRLQATHIEWISELNLVRLREINNEVLRVLEDVDAAKERTIILYEELFNIGQEKINQKMFILSMVTLIFMPLTFLCGLLGVNLAGIPLQQSPHGFLWFCWSLIGVFIVELFVLRRLKWL